MAFFALALVPAVLSAQTIEKQSEKPIVQALDRLDYALALAGFKVTNTHDLAASLKKEGFDRPPFFVVEACNAGIANQVLATSPSLGSMLPCAIAVYQLGGKTTFSTVPASEMAKLGGASASLQAQISMVDIAIRQALDNAAMPDDWFTAWNEANHFYKSALVATNNGDENATKAVRRFAANWSQYWNAYGGKVPEPLAGDALYAPMGSDVQRQIEMALVHVGRGEMAEAHESLEHVRGIWMRYRTAKGLDWFSDRVTAYHDAMEPILVQAKGLQADGMTAAKWADFQRKLEAAQTQWKRVQDKWGGSGIALRDLQWKQTSEPVSSVLAQLDAALKAKDAQAFLSSAGKLKPAFMRFFLAFG